ncbi:hypothetical protein [Sphingomonas jatrophae]|uniref:Uncharacterized protein n=1 Tax=Sphingomonas jatrophae TaxID=1166337 RepID=A0A1I6JW67_9SPHN|nr:hypothetical protein [Sphingomonas jatrophae]SFR83229.1 hypothetical protein SAMN05192580_0983 [Sphingomonas jatrophae]
MAKLALFAGAALLAGAAMGGVAGHATVTGMRPDAVVTERLAGAYGVPVRREPDLFQEVGDTWIDGLSGGREESNDWDEGYRWAKDSGIRTTTDCTIRGWTFQRGCETAVTDAALS